MGLSGRSFSNLCRLLLFVLLQSQALAAAPASLSETYVRLKALTQERSAEIHLAQAEADRAAAQTWNAWSRLLPRADLVLAQSRSRDYSILQSGALGSLGSQLFTPQAVALARWEIQLNLPLYKQPLYAGINQSSATQELSRLQLELRQGELDWRLRSLLGEYLIASYQQSTLRGSIDLARTSLREAELRFQLGSRTRIDVLRARTNLEDLESKKLSIDQSVAAALGNLVSYSGVSEQELMTEAGLSQHLASESSISSALDQLTESAPILDQIRPWLQFSEDPRPTLARKLAASRGPWLAFELQEKVRASQAQSSFSQELPDLSLQGSINRQGQDWGQAFSGGERSYSFGVLLRIPLFSGGSLWSSLAERRNGVQGAEFQRSKESSDFLTEVNSERIQILSNRSLIQARATALAHNQELVELTMSSYRLGKSTISDLLSSQNDLFNARTSLARSKLDLAILARRFAWNLGIEVSL